jgi:AraC-like DNA-binding protein
MSGVFYCRSELSAPWAIELPPFEGCLSFHVVTAGHCWLSLEGTEDRRLEEGDLTLVPHGGGHILSSEPGIPATRVDALPHYHRNDRYAILRHGGGGGRTSLVCGVVRFDHPAAHHLVAHLPPFIHVEASSSPRMQWLGSTLRLMAAEAKELRPGGETVVTRLSDILVIQAIRAWIEKDPRAQVGWLGALSDPQIGGALLLVHREPSRPWTVASLASEAAMSRSAFAARFTELVGEPVMQYVARFRMHLAKTCLEDEGAGVGEMAARLGYRSEAAFSRAFKRFIGVSPGTVRRKRGEKARWPERRNARRKLRGRTPKVLRTTSPPSPRMPAPLS